MNYLFVFIVIYKETKSSSTRGFLPITGIRKSLRMSPELMRTEEHRTLADGKHKATVALCQDRVIDSFTRIDIKVG